MIIIGAFEGRDVSNGKYSLYSFFVVFFEFIVIFKIFYALIGSGKFGTVYVVMNLTEQCLMAMKQIRIERNHKALHALVDEVENLRSLDHPNLVKYYAVEVHRVCTFDYKIVLRQISLYRYVVGSMQIESCLGVKVQHFQIVQAIQYFHVKVI